MLINAVSQGVAAIVIAVGLSTGGIQPQIGGPILLSALGCGSVAINVLRNGKK